MYYYIIDIYNITEYVTEYVMMEFLIDHVCLPLHFQVFLKANYDSIFIDVLFG